ncbi:MAG: hypothetical protein GY805_16845 [Chloroflexi bacterium]|nr:hypothetical protein [Chloroflexota bacterium]
MASIPLHTYAASRERLLAQIIATISDDDRFVAAWLTGSYSRSNQDALSDIDISIVVSDEYSGTLCHRPAQVSAQTTSERMDLFFQFGEIAILHENNHNAPDGGTFTNVIYAQTALIIDWILIPQKTAQRPSPSHMLFDRVGIPEAPPAALETLEQRVEKVSEITAFFWMMMAMTVKYLFRQDTVFVVTWLEDLQKMLREIKRLVAGEPSQYKGGSLLPLAPDCESQIEAIYHLAEEMVGLMPKIAALGCFVRPSPMPTLEILLNFAKEKCST